MTTTTEHPTENQSYANLDTLNCDTTAFHFGEFRIAGVIETEHRSPYPWMSDDEYAGVVRAKSALSRRRRRREALRRIVRGIILLGVMPVGVAGLAHAFARLVGIGEAWSQWLAFVGWIAGYAFAVLCGCCEAASKPGGEA